MDNFISKRECTDKDLPARPPQQASTEGLPKDEIVQSLLKPHHLHVDILKSMEVDPYKDYEQSGEENVLAKVRSGAKDCTICGKRCQNTPKLRKSHNKEAPEQD